jgi:hypothetical protein
MAYPGNNLQVPMYLKASSPQGLHRLMLMNNIKAGAKYTYSDIQYVNGYWYAWYYKPLEINEAGKEIAQIDKKEKA